MNHRSPRQLVIVGRGVAKKSAGHVGIMVCFSRKALRLRAIVGSDALMFGRRFGRGNECIELFL